MASPLASPPNGAIRLRREGRLLPMSADRRSDTRESAESVVVAIDAAKEITDYAVEWTLKNVIHTGDSMVLLAFLPVHKPQQSILKMLAGWSTLWGWLGGERTSARAMQDANSHRTEEGLNVHCSQMIQRLCKTSNVKQVHTEVKIVPAVAKGMVAIEAEKLFATWVILDRRLKNEAEFCMKRLQCNIVVVDCHIAKFLRFNLKRPPGGEALPFEEDVDSSSFIFPGLIPKLFDKPTMQENICFGETVYTGSDSGTPFSSPGLETTISPTKGSYCSSCSDQSELDLQRKPTKFSENSSKVAKTLPYWKPVEKTGLRLETRDNVIHGTRNFVMRSEKSMHKRFQNAGADNADSPRITLLESKSLGGHEGNVFATQTMPSSASRRESRKHSQGSFLKRSDYSNLKPSESRKLILPQIENDRKILSQMHGLPNLLPSAKEVSFSKSSNTERWVAGIEKTAKGGYFSENLGAAFQQDSPQRWSFERTSSIRKAMSLSSRAPPVPPPLCSICQNRAPVFGKPPKKFSYAELEFATDGFSTRNFLAEGGYGPVYKGVLPDGQVVAVKQHKLASTQGASEFCAEVEVLSCAQHRNVVMLIGYCMDDGEWLLVYEFACNGSLDTHLYGRRDKPCLEWVSRQKVAVSAARGLRYLHEECRVGCIIHRDLRPNNILLTHDFEAMVGDFGLARWQADGQSQEETRIIGTFGYLAPEYTQTGQITEKADVYSFGVLLLEILSGRKAIDISKGRGEQCLSEWARPMLEKKRYLELVDPCLGNRYSDCELEHMMYAASLCICQDPHMRPRMSKVLRILEGDVTYDRVNSLMLSSSDKLSLESLLLSRTGKDVDAHYPDKLQEISRTTARKSWSGNLRSDGQNTSLESPKDRLSDAPLLNCSPYSETSDWGGNDDSSISRIPSAGSEIRSLSATLSSVPTPESMASGPQEIHQPRKLQDCIGRCKAIENNRQFAIFPSRASSEGLSSETFEIHSSASDSGEAGTSSSSTTSSVRQSLFLEKYQSFYNNGLHQNDGSTVGSGESLVGFFEKLNEMHDQTPCYGDNEIVHIGSNMRLAGSHDCRGSANANLNLKDSASSVCQSSALSICRDPSVDKNGKLSLEALKLLYQYKRNYNMS